MKSLYQRAGQGLLATLALATSAAAHDWDLAVLYVDSVNGLPTNTGLSPSSPLPTIDSAVTFAKLFLTSTSTKGVTINVMPGDYLHTDELYPIELPAKGLTIEAYGDVRPVLNGSAGGSAVVDIFHFDEPGLAGRPGSVLENLALTNVLTGVRVDPGAAEFVQAVEVRGCEISNIEIAGVQVIVSVGSTAEHVVERCEIRDDFGPGLSTGISETTFGTSSCLYRSNQIFNVEDCLRVQGSGDATLPRVFSNFMWHAERMVSLAECEPVFVNNTLAYNKIHNEEPPFFDTLHGLLYEPVDPGLEITCANNIFWCPDVVWEGATYDSTDTVGLTFVDTFACDYFDWPTGAPEDAQGNMGVVPEFVGTPLSPGGIDLHLLDTSPLIDEGWAFFARAMPGIVTPIDVNLDLLVPDIVTAYPGGAVRTDIPIDVDGQPRFLRSTPTSGTLVDIGGDEVSDVFLAIVPDATADAFGTLRVPGMSTVSPTFTVTGAPGSSYLIQVGFVADPLNQNLYHSLWGNALIDPITPGLLLPYTATGTIPAGGTDTATLTISAGSPFLGLFHEDDLYVQALVWDPTNAIDGRFSNRVRIEFDL